MVSLIGRVKIAEGVFFQTKRSLGFNRFFGHTRASVGQSDEQIRVANNMSAE
jgi:hypothetical protein